MTEKQIENIRHGLGPYTLEKRFVARRGKMPINPHTGSAAKANDPSTWGTLNEALTAITKYDSKGIDGIGVELGNGLCGIDLDSVIDEQGILNPQARDVIRNMDSYTEISISGEGVHILFSGELPEGGRRKGNIEMYEEGRYFTLTGDLLSLSYELEVAK